MNGNKIKFLFTAMLIIYLVSCQVYANLYFHVHRHHEEAGPVICLKPWDHYHIHSTCCDKREPAHFMQYKEGDTRNVSTGCGPDGVQTSIGSAAKNRNVFNLYCLTPLTKSLLLHTCINNKAPPLTS
jgi:hypothetical protein